MNRQTKIKAEKLNQFLANKREDLRSDKDNKILSVATELIPDWFVLSDKFATHK